MRRFFLLVCLSLALATLFAACSSAPTPGPGTPLPDNHVPQNPPTIIAPTQFVEADQPITLNNVANLKYLGRLDQPGTSSTLFNYVLSPDATRLVGLNNEELLGWNLLDGMLLFQTARADAARVFYSSDKTELYTVDSSGLISIDNSDTGATKTSTPGEPNYSNVQAFSQEDGWLALGGTDGTVKVWDTYARTSLVTINAQTSAITALAFSADGSELATAGGEGVVRLWKWHDKSMIGEIKLEQPISINLLTFAPDGSSVAIGTNLDARLWSMSDLHQIDTLDVGRGGASQILEFSPDGRYLLAGNKTVGLSLWKPSDHALAAQLPDTLGETIAATFSPDSNLLITSVLNGKVALWNLVQITGTTLNQAPLNVGTQQILKVEWSSDSRLLLFFDAAGPIYLWGVGA